MDQGRRMISSRAIDRRIMPRVREDCTLHPVNRRVDVASRERVCWSVSVPCLAVTAHFSLGAYGPERIRNSRFDWRAPRSRNGTSVTSGGSRITPCLPDDAEQVKVLSALCGLLLQVIPNASKSHRSASSVDHLDRAAREPEHVEIQHRAVAVGLEGAELLTVERDNARLGAVNAARGGFVVGPKRGRAPVGSGARPRRSAALHPVGAVYQVW